MDAVAGLCDAAFVVDGGQISEKMSTDAAIERYLGGGMGGEGELSGRPRTQDRPRPPVFTGLRMYPDGAADPALVMPTGVPVRFELDLENLQDEPGNITAAVAVVNHRNQRIVLLHSEYQSGMTVRGQRKQTLTCAVDALPLTPGQYHLQLVCADGFKEIERVERAGELEVTFRDLFGTGKLPNQKQSNFALPARWSAAGVTDDDRAAGQHHHPDAQPRGPAPRGAGVAAGADLRRLGGDHRRRPFDGRPFVRRR